MTSTTIALLIIAAAFALANWWSRWRGNRIVEWITKPTVTALLIAALTAADPASGDVRAWFIGGLVMCLVGDVALMIERVPFQIGLAAFLIAHMAFVCGCVVDSGNNTAMGIIGLIVAFAVLIKIGRRITSAAAAMSSKLEAPVSGYLLVIAIMHVVAWRTGNGWAAAGASAFVVSDAVLGWDRFVRKLTWAPVTVMVTYHLALAGLVAFAATAN
ncbi:MAG: lysoplasmalogenase [Acidimicrobiia bacterium]